MARVVIYPPYSLKTQGHANKLAEWHDARRFKTSKWQGLVNASLAMPMQDFEKEMVNFSEFTNPKLANTLVPSKVYSYDVSGLSTVNKGLQNSLSKNLLVNSNMAIWENVNRMPPNWTLESYDAVGATNEPDDESDAGRFLSITKFNHIGGHSFVMKSALNNNLGDPEAGIFSYYRLKQSYQPDEVVEDMILSVQIRSPGDDVGYFGKLYCKYTDDQGNEHLEYKELTGYSENFRRYQLKLPFKSVFNVSAISNMEIGIEVDETLFVDNEGDVIYATCFQLESGSVASNWNRHATDYLPYIDRSQAGLSVLGVHENGLVVQLFRIDESQMLKTLYPTRAIANRIADEEEA